MPYTKSSARNQFENVINSLHELSKDVADAGLIYKSEVRQAVFRATIFQASAALEEYIRAVFEGWIYLLKLNNKKIGNLPKSLVYCIAGKKQLEAFKNYIAYNDEAKLINSLSDITRLSKLFNSDELVKDVVYNGEVISDKKYPAAKNIMLISKRFGINDIFTLMAIKGKKNYKLIIDSFNDIRTEIAHQYPSSDLTYEAIAKNIIDLIDFVSKVDMVIYAHVKDTSGEDCWQVD